MELTILVFLPAAAAAAIMVLPRSMEQNAKWLALTATVAMLALSVQMFFAFDLNASGYQMVVDKKWVTIDQFELRYALGVDAHSMLLVLLKPCLSVVSVLVSFRITKLARAYFAFLMLLVSLVVGVFVSLVFLLFFLFCLGSLGFCGSRERPREHGLRGHKRPRAGGIVERGNLGGVVGVGRGGLGKLGHQTLLLQ